MREWMNQANGQGPLAVTVVELAALALEVQEQATTRVTAF